MPILGSFVPQKFRKFVDSESSVLVQQVYPQSLYRLAVALGSNSVQDRSNHRSF